MLMAAMSAASAMGAVHEEMSTEHQGNEAIVCYSVEKYFFSGMTLHDFDARCERCLAYLEIRGLADHDLLNTQNGLLNRYAF